MIDIGVVTYRILAEGDKIEATWYSSRHADKGCGTGLAVGDTSNGFPGNYEITYRYANGQVSAELELEIEQHGQAYNFYYRKDGKLLMVGVGVETAEGLAGGYRMVEPPAA